MERSLDRRWMLAAGLVVAVLLVAGCGPGVPTGEVLPEGPAGEVELDAEDDGSQVALAVGQVLVVTLASNPTTGYSWQVADGLGPALAQLGEPLYLEAPKDGTPLVGAGGTETFRFEAKAAGQTRLVLEYRRPWEENAEPIDQFEVEVVVR